MRILMILFLAFLLTSCASLEEGGFLQPQPVASKYLYTKGAGFTFTAGDPNSVKYSIWLEILKPFKNGSFLEVQFENPSDKRSPIIVMRDIKPEDKEISLESPPIYGLRSYEGYVVEVYIYDNADKKNLLGIHRQVIRSIMDQSQMEKIWKK